MKEKLAWFILLVFGAFIITALVTFIYGLYMYRPDLGMVLAGFIGAGCVFWWAYDLVFGGRG